MSMIQIPDDLYAKIVQQAAKEAQPVEAIAAAWLIKGMPTEVVVAEDKLFVAGYDPASDPFSRFIGAFDFGVTDLAENHDRYLAEAYADNHDQEK